MYNRRFSHYPINYIFLSRKCLIHTLKCKIKGVSEIFRKHLYETNYCYEILYYFNLFHFLRQ